MPHVSETPTTGAGTRLMTITEAAAYLNVPRRWVAEAVRLHRVRYTRIGKHVRFRAEHLDELIEAGEEPVLGPPSLSMVPRQQRTSGRSRL
ncbi:MAG: hypothetical protein JWO46_1135 [Nocardioidaceae bacterium]|nr:hypothetical protein [Nocardioidaceae bacterium]